MTAHGRMGVARRGDRNIKERQLSRDSNEASRIERARSTREAVKPFDDQLAENLRAEVIAAKITEVEQDQAEVKRLQDQLSRAVETKNAHFAELNDLLKRVRSGVKSTFDDDSMEYEAVGGTRRSERKKPLRKPKVE